MEQELLSQCPHNAASTRKEGGPGLGGAIKNATSPAPHPRARLLADVRECRLRTEHNPQPFFFLDLFSFFLKFLFKDLRSHALQTIKFYQKGPF